ncbi:hypothetical protein AC579_1412 [Pseudocercospora musae]|uniref:Hydrophobin n=1 Tax=Pseudocercospora musae TaxID=113226 RepID=A0A139GTE6_9PEZI|nr:hypothetical protein AC579_1412 [Pseudocercospora musae]
MQLLLFTLCGLSAFALAAPAAVPEAAPLTAVEDAATAIFARTGSGACCPKGSYSGCSPCQRMPFSRSTSGLSTETVLTTSKASQSCPSDKPDKYTSCNNVAGLVVLCNVLNGNTISIPISLDLLSL